MPNITRDTLGRLTLVAALAAPVGACAAAAGAAGAAGANAYTERGAETNLDATVPEVISATEAAFSEMDIELTATEFEEGGTEAELTGRQEDTEVVVSIERDGDGLTHVHVTARENMVDYDPDHAEEILRGIVQRT